MFVRLLLLFSIIPLLELALLIKMGSLVGVLPTILLVCVTGVTGAYLAKSQGFKILAQVRDHLQHGQIPADHLIEGMLIMIGGLLLLTPGLITDLSGFLLLVPATRRLIARWGKRKFTQWIERGSMHFSYDEYREQGPTGPYDWEDDTNHWSAREAKSHDGTTEKQPEADRRPTIDVEYEDIRE